MFDTIPLFYLAFVASVLLGVGSFLAAPAAAKANLREWFGSFRTDPPPFVIAIGNLARELADEYGPQLQSSTNRNAILLGVTSFLGVILPRNIAEAGAGYLIAGLTVYYVLRTMAGRKRAAGPIVTPSDDPSIQRAREREQAEQMRSLYAQADAKVEARTMGPYSFGGVCAQTGEYNPEFDMRSSAAADAPSPADAPGAAAEVETIALFVGPGGLVSMNDPSASGPDPMELPAYLNNPPPAPRAPRKVAKKAAAKAKAKPKRRRA